MVTVGARELRTNIKHYLDLVKQGEEVLIIRHSEVIGRLVPVNVAVDGGSRETDSLTYDGVKFRRYGLYEDPYPVRQLYESVYGKSAGNDPLAEADLDAPGEVYGNNNGEFWVGEKDGEIVALGGFQWVLGGDLTKAELKRLCVRPELRDAGLETRLAEILEERMRRRDYKEVVICLTGERKWL